mmetsp:Transcript_6567/g.9920  ORF Transcript_6567/g.9920 Transcript_6567/m.9920 type:complete len:303 (-) Transcript_6567:111-1019(-)
MKEKKAGIGEAYQYIGGKYPQSLFPSRIFRVSLWVRFLDDIPPPSSVFGLKGHGHCRNLWVQKAKKGEWLWVSEMFHATGNDNSWVLMIFDSVYQKFAVEMADMTIEHVPDKEPPAQKPPKQLPPYPKLENFEHTILLQQNSNFFCMGMDTKFQIGREFRNGEGVIKIVDDGAVEYRKPKGGSMPLQWVGFQEVGRGFNWIRLSFQIRFNTFVPPRSDNYGAKLHGEIRNEWVTRAEVGEWLWVSEVGKGTNCDTSYVIIIFDTCVVDDKPLEVEIAHIELELVRSEEEPLPKGPPGDSIKG